MIALNLTSIILIILIVLGCLFVILLWDYIKVMAKALLLGLAIYLLAIGIIFYLTKGLIPDTPILIISFIIVEAGSIVISFLRMK